MEECQKLTSINLRVLESFLKLVRATELYMKSLALYPTAEAYTFRGWACIFQGRLEEAIRPR